MNRKWFGIILIFLGIGLILAFIILFFVMPRRNGEVAPGGSLPEVPFGNGQVQESTGGGTGTGTGQDGTGDIGSVLEAPDERQLLFQITDFPVTGYAPYTQQKEILDTVVSFIDIENEDGTITTEEYSEEIATVIELPKVRYHDKIGGLIYDTIIDNGLETIELIDTAINAMHESYFAGPNRLFMRYFDDDSRIIKTYRGTLSSSVANAFCPFDFVNPYQLGDTGRDIESIQRIISQVITPQQQLSPAVFDEAMELAVKDFQEMRGIQVDGSIRAQTNEQLQEACLEIEQRALEQEIRESDETPFTFSGIFIDDNIEQFAVSPDQEDIFRLIDRETTAWGILSDLTGGGPERIYDFDFRDWIIEWAAPRIISFNTKASGLIPGNLYLYDLDQQNLFNVLKGYNGLTSKTSPDGSRALYSYTVGQTGNQFGVVTVSDRTLTPLLVNTLPEKCVWSNNSIDVYCMVPQQVPAALYPDRWYQGEVIFDDTLWKINTQNGTTSIIETFSTVLFDLDGVRLQLTDDESFVFIIDQRTGFLWARDLVN